MCSFCFKESSYTILYHTVVCMEESEENRNRYRGEIPVPFSVTEISLFTLGVATLFKFQLDIRTINMTN